MKKLQGTGIDNHQISDALLKDIARRCAKEKLATIEPFGPASVPMLSGTLFILFLIICVLFPIGIFV